MPRARHLSDSSEIASELECEDGVDIDATPSTSAKQTRKVKARSSVSTQPEKAGCKMELFRISEVFNPKTRLLQKAEVRWVQQAAGSGTTTTVIPLYLSTGTFPLHEPHSASI
jgi:hypothetical protein